MQEPIHVVLLCLIPTPIFISCLVLHFRQHYRCNCCHKTPPKLKLSPRSESEIEIFIYDMLRKKKCPTLFLPVDDEVFNFFPKSFIFYLSYLTLLTLLILINAITHNQNNNNNTLILQTYTFHSWSHINAYSDSYTDWISIYCILMFYVWDSLYSFYRYYSTLFISTEFRHVRTLIVICKFMYYAIPFCALFMICIHCYYYLYPIIIVIHLYFNCFCTYKHSDILLASYSHSADTFVSENIRKLNNKMLRNVCFMRKIQLISCIMSTLSMALFLFVYDSKIIIYLPISWTVSALLLTSNFIRNRQCIWHSLFRIYQKCKFKLRSDVKTQNNLKNVYADNKNTEIELKLARIKLQDTKSEPMILSPLENKTFSYSVSKITKPNTYKTAKILSDSAPTSPKSHNSDEYLKEKRKSKWPQIGNDYEFEENIIFYDDNSSHPIVPYSKRILLQQSYSDPIAPNCYDFMRPKNESAPKLESFLTCPLPTDLTAEIPQFMTETEEKYDNGRDSLTVDVCFDVLISQGFADRKQLNSIKQLRQFNQKKLPKHITL